MRTIRNPRYAGRSHWIGSALVQFDGQGYAVGIIKRPGPGPALDPPQPLDETVLAAAQGAAGFEIVDAPAPSAEAPVEAEQLAPEAAPVEVETPELPDLAAMRKIEIYRYCTEELGLEFDYARTTKQQMLTAAGEALSARSGG